MDRRRNNSDYAMAPEWFGRLMKQLCDGSVGKQNDHDR